MSRDNVKRVLVTTGNAAPAATGTKVDDLALGQIGVFDYETNLAVDKAALPEKVFIAVGTDTLGSGVMNDIKVSTGQFIQPAGLRSYSFRPHTASRPMIVELQGVVDADVEVDKEFAIKFEFRNHRIYKLMGTNAFTHTYAVKSTGATANSLAQDFVDAINANDHAYISASLGYTTNAALTVATDSTSKEYAAGDVITVQGDIDIAEAKGTLVSSLQVTAEPLQVNRAVNLNLLYNDLRETVVIPSAVEGFSSATSFGTVQELAFEEGDGSQVRQLEYNETGVARPYVLSDATGTAKDMEYNAVGGVKYDQTVLEYSDKYQAGWLKHENDLQTTIAVPATDTVTRDALVEIFDAMAAESGLGSKANVAKSSDVDPAVVEESGDDATQVV